MADKTNIRRIRRLRTGDTAASGQRTAKRPGRRLARRKRRGASARRRERRGRRRSCSGGHNTTIRRIRGLRTGDSGERAAAGAGSHRCATQCGQIGCCAWCSTHSSRKEPPSCSLDRGVQTEIRYAFSARTHSET